MKIITLLLICLSFLQAHKLYLMADDDGDKLYVKSYFTKSSMCQDCKVNIYDTNNKLLYTQNTDKKGRVTFPYTHKEVNIEVIASMGHKNQISYEGENEIKAEQKVEENESYTKILFSLLIIFSIFFLLKLVKK